MNAIADEFRGELARLDVLAHREILRLRAAYQLTLDELRGVYISDDQVDQMVARMRAGEDGSATVAELTAEAQALRARVGDDSPLARFARRLGLDDFERDVVLVALAPELDLKYETLFAYLNNNAARRRATIDLVLRLCGRGRREDRERLHLSQRLFRDGVLEFIDPVPERRSALGNALGLSPAASAALQGLAPWDERLSPWVEPLAREPVLAPGEVDKLDRAADALRRAGDLLLVIEGDVADAREGAIHVLRRMGRGALRVDLNALPPDLAALTPLPVVSRLRNDGVLLDLGDVPSEAGQRGLSSLSTSLLRVSVSVVVAVPPKATVRALERDHRVLRVRLEVPDPLARRALWSQCLERESLDPEALPLNEVAEHFALGRAQIGGAARVVAGTAPFVDARDGREKLFEAARAQSSGDLGHLATPVRHLRAWSDLVLPRVVLRRLRELAEAVHSRSKVFDEWGFGERGGRGLMALFAGASGTGKTMSAGVIARDIGLELYRIDLASVVSKYIGETEKNLHRIFEAARSANAILFFDEADALLGKRSEVKDAHDRYANIEVAYLLQKMEEHDGVVILASNLAKNMDQAFARRMHFVLDFPRPDAALRERLWREIFPPATPIGADVDFGFLARRFDITGGDMKTIALDAAFFAAGRDRPVGMRELIGAVSRQMLKQGRPIGGSDFRQYHASFSEEADGAQGGNGREAPEGG
jgi:hypothetical protein